MIDRLAGRLAVVLHHHSQDTSISLPVLKYGLIIVLDSVIIVSLSLILGGMTGKLQETAIGMGVFLLFRAISGGHHLNTSMKCIILSTFLSVSIPHIPLHESASVIITIISTILFAVYAPSNLQKQSRIPRAYYPLLKAASTALVAGSYMLNKEVITLSIFIQAVSLIHFQREGR